MNKPRILMPPTQLPIVPHTGGMTAYDPPETADGAPLQPFQPPIQGITDDVEAWVTNPPLSWPWPQDGLDLTTGIAGKEVYKTQKFWKAIDVYFSTPTDPAGGLANPFQFHGAVLSVFVYAFTLSGQRVCVGSGRYTPPTINPAGSLFFSTPQHICTVRQALAQQYEVRVCMPQPGVLPFTPKSQPLTIMVVASNDTTPKDESVGVLEGSTFGVVPSNLEVNAIAANIPFPELVGFTAVNNAAPAAARFLQYFDFAGAPLVGNVPIYVWPLGDAAGDGYENRTFRRRAQAFALRASSTAPTFTGGVADCVIQAFVR